jgi:hypothetical protein
MAALDKTRLLIAKLAKQIGLKSLPSDDSGGYRLTIGASTEVFIYGGDDVTILVVAPVAPLPRDVEYGLAVYLLRGNLFDADTAPFQIAVDDGGVLIFWGRVRIADFDGATLATLLDRVAAKVEEIRGEVGGADAAA